MKRTLIIFAAVLAGAAFAQDPVGDAVRKDLIAAQAKLTSQREQQSAARAALSAKITELQNDLIVKRRQADISRRSVSDQRALLQSLKTKNYASSATVEALNDGLRSYGIKLSTQLLPGQVQDARLDPIFSPSSDANESVLQRIKALEVGLESIEAALGGQIRSASATGDDARIVNGEVLSFGPSHYFRSSEGSLTGSYVVSRSGRVGEVDDSDAEIAEALFAGGETSATIDITGGKARALAEIKNGPIELIRKGGAWVYPILLIALIALLCALRKFLELRKTADVGDEKIHELSSRYFSSDAETAVSSAAGLQHPVREVLPSVMTVLRTSSIDLGEEVLYERLIPVREGLRRWLPFIAVTAAIAPLLGLLGTVSGLIKTFAVIAIEGTGEAQSISGGISEALITTLFGLAVAIPAFIAHALLSRRAKGIEQTTERLALVFLNDVRKAQTGAQLK